MIDHADLVDRLVRAASSTMPTAKADEFAAYLGHPGLDQRWLDRNAPARLPEITLDRPSRRPRKARICNRTVPEPAQPRLL